MTIKELRASTGLSQQAFADKYNIPKRTLENWEMEGSAHRDCPEYVKTLLERAVSEDCKIIIDNQTVLPDREAIVTVVGCLMELENGYKVTIEDNVYILKRAPSNGFKP